MQSDNKNIALETHNIDLTFKKSNYTNTYMIIETIGIPNDAILYLCDNDLNQLYSPVDVNGNANKTPCTIITGQTSAIQLPANYNGYSFTDFDVGTYNWKLKYDGNAIYKEKVIPITVKIVDFKVWDPINSIYPDEQLYVNVKNYDNTIPTMTEADDLYGHISEIHGSENVIYEDVGGTLSFYDMNIDVGQHTYCPDNLPSHNIEYEVKNPITFITTSDNSFYRTSKKYIGYIIERIQLFALVSITSNSTTLTINNKHVSSSPMLYQLQNTEKTILLWEINGTNFPPGQYHCVVTTPTLRNGKQYTDNGDFIVPTENCTLTLTNNDNTLIVTYLYQTTPIPNASIIIYDNNNDIAYTDITNNNGQITYTPSDSGIYQASAIDFDNTKIITSNTIKLDTYLSSIIFDNNNIVATYIPSVSINNTSLISNISISTANDDTNGKLIITKTNIVNAEDNNLSNIITDLDLDENTGNLIIKK